MFGQAMATFIPPMLRGVVVFMRGYNPSDIVQQIRSRRVSVLVSVPKILEVLREHAERSATSAAHAGADVGFAGHGAAGATARIARRWWRHWDVHQLFGAKFWAFVVGAAPLDPALEAFWGDLGFAVIQGYGLTETAPIVTLNHPFGTERGSVGKAIAGVEMKLADDGEILVRGENVTTGYFNAERETAQAFEGGWFHTGDIGEIGANGQVFIRGRKKEMIVTPEGLNVFPEDVERVLTSLPGVRDSAVVGAGRVGAERVHAVLVVDPGVSPDDVVRAANVRLADHQKIRRAIVWPEPELPRTEGTRKLKRSAIREWVMSGDAVPRHVQAGSDAISALVARYAGRERLASNVTLAELGLSSLERVELMVALEDAFGSHIDEAAFAGARDMSDLKELVERGAEAGASAIEPVDFPSWNRSWLAQAVRRVSQPTWILPLARMFAWLTVGGADRLNAVSRPVIFAANHQSHMDTPVVLSALPARLRYRVAPAMAKEFFKAHFFPAGYPRLTRFTNGLNYYLAALFFNAFPLPQREAGTRQTVRYIGDVLESGYSVLIFPEGKRSLTGDIDTFRPGIGMLASKLGVPVVPVRIRGLDRVLHPDWKMARPGRVRVAFGAPMTFAGEDYEAIAKQVEDAVRAL
jgi:long-chain acyl-CoA synthetase